MRKTKVTILISLVLLALPIVSCSPVAKDQQRPETTKIDDFDCDGTVDSATLATKEDRNAWLLVSSSRSSKAPYVVLMENVDDLANLELRVTAPSEFVTACGQGYFDCTNGLTERVRTTCNAIIVNKKESWERLFYWDDSKAGYSNDWLAD